MTARLAKVLTAVLFAAALTSASSAWAFDETGNTTGGIDFPGYCYPQCHGGSFSPQGPHGGYATSSDKCGICHDVHAAPGGVKLLPGATVVDTCFTCHDGTGGQGVYGAIAARTGQPAAGVHRYSATNVIPGGDSATGGAATRTFRETTTGNLICTDCHSPHDADTVADFAGDRWRTTNKYMWTSSKLLRRKPTGADTAVDAYGSDWCLGCHGGRDSGGTVHNHPVDTSATASGNPYTYANLPVLDSDALTGVTVLGGLAGDATASPAIRWNRAFLMPVPRTPLQTGHAPICQQCHEDSRTVGGVGTLSADGSLADAAPVTITTPDGTTATDNPRFQNFPHETVNDKLLVESNDDLCTNCHVSAALP